MTREELLKDIAMYVENDKTEKSINVPDNVFGDMEDDAEFDFSDVEIEVFAPKPMSRKIRREQKMKRDRRYRIEYSEV